MMSPAQFRPPPGPSFLTGSAPRRDGTPDAAHPPRRLHPHHLSQSAQRPASAAALTFSGFRHGSGAGSAEKVQPHVDAAFIS
jgi:hypothetical protein